MSELPVAGRRTFITSNQPRDVSWCQFFGGASLAGIGFAVSLFVTGLLTGRTARSAA